MDSEDCAIAHVIADYERQRTAALRNTRDARLLLVDAVHAVSNGNIDAALDILSRVSSHTDHALDALLTN